MDAEHVYHSLPDPRWAQNYTSILSNHRGLLSLEQCLHLHRRLNTFLIPFRDGVREHQDGTLELLLLLGGDTAKGPLDRFSKFVEVFGSPEAQEMYAARRPRDLRAMQPELAPLKTPPTVQRVREYVEFLVRHWLGFTSQ